MKAYVCGGGVDACVHAGHFGCVSDSRQVRVEEVRAPTASLSDGGSAR